MNETLQQAPNLHVILYNKFTVNIALLLFITIIFFFIRFIMLRNLKKKLQMQQT